MPKLSDPIQIGSHLVKNRVTFAPTVKFNWTDGSGMVIDRFVRHYADRAKAECGLICVEATCVAPEGRLAPTQLGLWDDAHIPGQKQITDACHAYGATMLVQLHHGGAVTHPECGPAKGPSASDKGRRPSEALTLEEIHTIREQFIAAAVRAQKAGYDGIQLHACHGYVLNQFACDTVNHRTDEYGGSTENKARLTCEIIRGIRAACGKDFIISARIPGAQPTIEEGIRMAELFVEAGCDYLQVSDGIGPYDREPHDESLPYTEVCALGVALHKHFAGRVPVSSVHGIYTVELARYLVEEGLVDTVDLAKALLADPNFARAAVEGGDYIRCFGCKICFWSPFMPRRCPAMMKRREADPDCSDYVEELYNLERKF